MFPFPSLLESLYQKRLLSGITIIEFIIGIYLLCIVILPNLNILVTQYIIDFTFTKLKYYFSVK